MQCGKYRISGLDSKAIHSQSGHAPVTESVSSEKLSLARHPGGANAGRDRSCARAAPWSANARHLCAECAFLAWARNFALTQSREHRRAESRLIRTRSDIGTHKSGPFAHAWPELFRATAPAAARGMFSFCKKTGKYRRDEPLDWTPNDLSYRGYKVDFPGCRWHERAARLYLRHER